MDFPSADKIRLINPVISLTRNEQADLKKLQTYISEAAQDGKKYIKVEECNYIDITRAIRKFLQQKGYTVIIEGNVTTEDTRFPRWRIRW